MVEISLERVRTLWKKHKMLVISIFSTSHNVVKFSHFCYVFQSAYFFNPFPKRQFLDSSKLKEFDDDNFKFDENVRKFCKWVENTVEKREIARYEQFLLFPQCFEKTCTADT